MNWLVLGDGFGWQKFDSHGIHWIYWSPGQATQEGKIAWIELGITPQIEGALHKSSEALHKEVFEKALPLMKLEVARRTTQNSFEALHDEIVEALGSHKNQAMCLSKAYLNQSPIEIVNFFRHQLTPYDAQLRRGADRGAATMSAVSDLLEILGVYRTFKSRILALAQNCPPFFEYHVNLARLPHIDIYRVALRQAQDRANANA